MPCRKNQARDDGVGVSGLDVSAMFEAWLEGSSEELRHRLRCPETNGNRKWPHPDRRAVTRGNSFHGAVFLSALTRAYRLNPQAIG